MSLHQLKILYNFVDLEFSLDSGKLLELKKILLLYLRSSPDGKLEIQGKSYTKNDFLQILAKEYPSTDQFDIYAVLKEHPSIAPLMNPKNIDVAFVLLHPELEIKIEIEKHKQWKEIRAFFSEFYFMDFYASILKDLRELNFSKVNHKLSYLIFFKSPLQVKCKKALKDALIALIKKYQNSLAEIKFINFKSYYQVIIIIGNDDPTFLAIQYSLLRTITLKFSRKQQEVFYKNQLKLRLTREMKNQIKLHQADINVRPPKSNYVRPSSPPQEEKASKDNIEITILLFLLVLGLVIFGIMMSSGSSSTDDNEYQIPDSIKNIPLEYRIPTKLPDLKDFEYIPPSIMESIDPITPLDPLTTNLDSIIEEFHTDMNAIKIDSNKRMDSLNRIYEIERDSIINEFENLTDSL